MTEDWARPVVHWEIQARDAAKMKAFYSAMFNWNIGDGRVKDIPAGIGAPEPAITGHLRESGQSRVTLYIQVLKLKESLARATELGGSVLREPFDLPTGTTLAWIADPEGNQVVLVQQ